MLSDFEIHAPGTIEEASGLLAQYGWDAALYAGGTELLMIMREGLAAYRHLIDIKHIPGIDGIQLSPGGHTLHVGAAATHRDVETSGLVATHAPLLAVVESMVANIRVRVAGTVGGNLCFAEPHSDVATLLTAWQGATVTLASTSGARDLAVGEFFVDLFTTAREDHEVMTAINIPLLGSKVGGGFQKFVKLERPTANVAVFMGLDGGRISGANIAVGCVGPIPMRAAEAEQMLRGESPDEDLFEQVAAAAAKAVDPVSDVYGSANYKRQLVHVLTRRSLSQALRRADGVTNE